MLPCAHIVLTSGRSDLRVWCRLPYCRPRARRNRLATARLATQCGYPLHNAPISVRTSFAGRDEMRAVARATTRHRRSQRRKGSIREPCNLGQTAVALPRIDGSDRSCARPSFPRARHSLARRKSQPRRGHVTWGGVEGEDSARYVRSGSS